MPVTTVYTAVEENGGGNLSPEDARDFRADLVASAHLRSSIPHAHKNKDFSYIKSNNQGESVACTAFSVNHAMETMNSLEFSESVALDPWELWNLQKIYPGTVNSSGDYLRSALKACSRFGMSYREKKLKIQGYARIEVSEMEIKRWIASKFPVLVSVSTTKPRSGETTWSVARDTGYMDISGELSGGGHAFEIPNYSGDEFEATNSFGSTWGAFGDGSFRFTTNEIPAIREAWILFDETDLLEDRIFLDIPADHWAAKEIEEVMNDGILMGSDSESGLPAKDRKFYPDQPLTRAQMAMMWSRMKKYLGR